MVQLNRKHLLLLLVIAVFGASLFSMQKQRVIRSRVVPLFNDQGQWQVLLGHDKGGYWTDFSEEIKSGENPLITAQRAIQNQTNKIYAPKMKKFIARTTHDGDTVYFITVKNKRGRAYLHEHGINLIKDDFAWFNVNEFEGAKPVTKPHEKQDIPVSRGVRAMLGNYLPEVIKELTGIETKKPAPVTEKVPIPSHLKKSLLTWLPQEKRYLWPEYRNLSSAQRQSLLSILPAAAYQTLDQALRKKLKYTGFKPAEEQDVINQYIIEDILRIMTRYDSLSINKMVQNIEKLEVCSAKERDTFNKALAARNDPTRITGLTAIGKITCNAGLLQWD